MKERILPYGRAMLVGLLLSLSLAACGGGDDGPSDTPAPGTPGDPEPPKVSLRCAP
ncbi:MAG: hypothetical protein QHC78_05155 [Pigmentiphaga sp.]|uniref:hypothetical protein n=1 Tax=Pigmentiphaga sp. TaxID=1977564 RepID=UPI0029B96755|nr:hypothetical protein [Pigmentiphaga sp.]MDX3905059.1 hypothetical protein [Pigmentiphaga sp.]